MENKIMGWLNLKNWIQKINKSEICWNISNKCVLKPGIYPLSVDQKASPFICSQINVKDKIQGSEAFKIKFNHTSEKFLFNQTFKYICFTKDAAFYRIINTDKLTWLLLET